MRNAFFGLLFANLAYFAWAKWVDTPRPAPVNETISRLPRLKLASEAPVAQPPAATPERTAFIGASGCTSVGPFADVDNSARAAASLRAKGLDSRQRAEAGEVSTDYQVDVTGMKSEAEATRTLKSLQRLGFKDAGAMPDGEDGGRRISLGLFNERASAEQRVWAARLKGFSTELTEQKRVGSVYWVDFMAPVGAVPIQGLLASGMSSRITVRPCPAAFPAVTTAAKDPAAPAHQSAIAAVPKLP